MIFCDVSGPRSRLGGIGNNMFKIAASLSLAKKNNDELLISDWRYNIFRDDRLKFGLKRECLEIDYGYHEESFFYHPIKYKKNMEIVGSFQSEKHFDKDHVRFCFVPQQHIVDYVEKKHNEYTDGGNSAFIHIRRGDYLTNFHHPVLDLKYYEQSIEELSKVDIFLVFSDDIKWCKRQELFKKSKFHIISGEKDYIDLFLMSKCENGIIANSSFSWWGAWLIDNNEKKIIAPKEWFSGDLITLSTSDLIPKEWKVI